MQENKQEKSTIKRGILKYLEYKGVSEYKFYKDSGITRGVLSQNNGLSEDNLTRFLAYAPDVSLRWLLTGTGNMFESLEDSPPKAAPRPSHITNNEKDFAVDQLLLFIKEQALKIEDLSREIGRLQAHIELTHSDLHAPHGGGYFAGKRLLTRLNHKCGPSMMATHSYTPVGNPARKYIAPAYK